MPVVKVMCDWMKCNSEVIMTCAHSSQSVWCRLSVLLNFLPSESAFTDHEQCWIEELKQVILGTHNPDWRQLFPLHEDTNLTQFSPLKEIHKSVNMKINTRLTDAQEVIVTILDFKLTGFLIYSNLATKKRGWSGGAKVLCILDHQGVQLILAYSWARPAILVVGKGRGGMFLFLLFLHFHSCSSFFPVPLFHLLYSLFYLFSPFLWETTQNDPQGLTCR